ncbi:AMP-binding protein [Nibricoccus sp. IMCC34717]|uniref:AMP-binding protein n=1 Tax=Nibricoccus sp. IMCC34717 TaxID=3034021 RepID=UPI003851822B
MVNLERYTGSNWAPFRSILDRRGSEQAVRFGAGSWSYQQLLVEAGRYISFWNTTGIPVNSSIGILAERSPFLVSCILAAIIRGNRFALIDASYPQARVLRCATAGDVEYLQRLSQTSDQWDAPISLLAHLEPGSHENLGFEISGSAEFLLKSRKYTLFTSGTTGEPKAITTDLAPLGHFIAWHAQEICAGPRDRFSLLSGPSHDPILRDIFTPLAVGATLCIPDQHLFNDPPGLFRWLCSNRISVIHCTPPHIRMLNPELSRSKEDWGPRVVCFGGDILRYGDLRAILKRNPECRIINFYGATETPQAMTFHSPSAREVEIHRDEDPVPIGEGIPDVTVALEKLQADDAGEAGRPQIVLRTPFLSLTALESLPVDCPEPIFYTGDTGVRNSEGKLVLLGRLDDQVKIRGFRIMPGEVASALAKISGVANAAVISQSNAVSGASLVAFVTPVDPRSAEGLLDYVRQEAIRTLPSYMVPRDIHILDFIPLNPNGKVDRLRLRSFANKEEAPLIDTNANLNLEAVIVGLFEKFLGRKGLSSSSDFFVLGGNSLDAVALSGELELQLGRRVDGSCLFRTRTPQGLARYLSDELTTGQKSQVSANDQRILDELQRIADAWRSSPGNLSSIAGSCSMRSSPAIAPLVRLMFATRRQVLEKIACYLSLRFEGGAWYTLTLREMFEKYHGMRIGHYSSYCFEPGRFKRGTSFGRFCDITRTARFETANHPSNTVSSHAVFYNKQLGFSKGVSIPRSKISIGHDVHIGHNAVLLYPACTVGNGAIIGSSAVVTQNVPPYAVVTGYPARVLRYRFSDKVIERLEQTRWWELPIEAYRSMPQIFTSPLESDHLL